MSQSDPDLLWKRRIHFIEDMRTIGGDMNAGIWIIFNHQWSDLEIIGGEDGSGQIWSKGPAVTYTWQCIHGSIQCPQCIHGSVGNIGLEMDIYCATWNSTNVMFDCDQACIAPNRKMLNKACKGPCIHFEICFFFGFGKTTYLKTEINRIKRSEQC